MAKRRPTQSDFALQTIRRLADNPDRAKVTRRCEQELIQYNLTTCDLCDALCDWIDEGNALMEAITDKAPGHIGEPMWKAYPGIHGRRWYLKVRVIKEEEWKLLLITVHPFTKKPRQEKS